MAPAAIFVRVDYSLQDVNGTMLKFVEVVEKCSWKEVGSLMISAHLDRWRSLAIPTLSSSDKPWHT